MNIIKGKESSELNIGESGRNKSGRERGRERERERGRERERERIKGIFR